MTAPELAEAADEDGFTPLHLAVIQGNLGVVNLLLANHKADVNALDNEGHSVVHWATVCGEVDALKAVLKAGANVSTPDVNGGSPMHYAAQMCGANYEGKSDKASAKLALDILAVLVGHPKSSVEVEDKDGRQPLLWAASAGSAKAILCLIKNGAYVESSDKDGLTALHCAASRGHTECLDTLINLCGAQTDLIDSNGCTALHYAVTLGHADASSLLLNLEADPNRQDRKGRTPAHCACAKGQFETVKILGSRNANLWLRNARGDLPVHEAASAGRKELVEWLLKQKPNHINTTSNDGRTLLHIAAGSDNSEMCKMLIDLGAEVNSIYRNPKNVVKTPLDCALGKGHRGTAKFIQVQGGLPASKLRLSGKKSLNILPDLDEVRPLQNEVGELEGTYRSKRSDSDTEDDRDRRKSKHRKCSHHRRTSSCSESMFCSKESACEIGRSKSTTELSKRSRRSKHRHHSNTSSDESSDYSGSESSYEECCYHIKRKHRCYKKGRSKTKEVTTTRTKKSIKHRSESSEARSNGDNKHSDESKGRSKKKLEASGRNSISKLPPTKSKPEPAVKTVARPSSSVPAIKGAKRPTTAKPPNIQRKSSQEDKEKDKVDSEKEKEKEKEKVKEKEKPKEVKIKTPEPPEEIPCELQLKSITPPPPEEHTTPEEDISAKEVITQAEIHETHSDKEHLISDKESANALSEGDDGFLTDATYTVDKREVIDLTATMQHSPIVEEEEKLVLEVPPPVEVAKKVSFKADVEKPPEIIEAHCAKPVEELNVLAVKKDEIRVPSTGATPSTTPEPFELPSIELNMQLTIPIPIKEIEQDRLRTATPSPCLPPTPPPMDPSLIDLEPRPSSQTPDSVGSFTVLNDGDDANEKLREFEEMTGGQDEYNENFPLDEQEIEDTRTEIPKRKSKRRQSEEYQDDQFKDQDSGFEPSPRSMRSKIPAPRGQVDPDAGTPHRSLPGYESRPKSTRAEGRKPGDQNAVNMTTVSNSIQKNIKRYYMERKIFQHLLEVKSLQIRSSKANEPMLVKRAIDDYHKSVQDLGYETGGAMARYPYRDFTFKSFELFLYDTLKGLQKPGTFNFQNLSEVYQEAERRLTPNRCDKALYCTTKTHRCLHAAHAYTGIPCAAYIPTMNHHTMPKLGYGQYRNTGVGNFYLPKIMTNSRGLHSKVSLEFTHGSNKKLIPLPAERLEANKRYYVTFTLKDNDAIGGIEETTK